MAETSDNKESSVDDKESKGRKFVLVAGLVATGEKPPINYLTAFMHFVKGYVGTGIFAMGEAFKNSGVILGPVLLAVIAVLNLICQHIIVEAAVRIADQEEEDVKPSFAETVEYTIESSENDWLKRHSKRLGLTTNIFLCITEMGFCCVYFVFIAAHMIEITSPYGFLHENELKSKHIMLAIILVPMWLSTFLGNLKLLLPLSIIANLVMWTGIILVFYFTLTGEQNTDTIKYFQYKTLPMFFGTALFAFEGITFILPLRNEMKHPHQFVSFFGVLNTGMTFVFLLYGAVGYLAYLKYGKDVASSVFLNLPNEDILAQVTKGLMCVGILFTFTLHMYIPFEVTYPLFHRKYGPFKHELLVKCLYRSTAVLITYTLANVVPFLGLFISLVGASTGAILTLVLPPVIDYIAHQGKLKVMRAILNLVIFTVGCVGTITGTLMSIYDIVTEFSNYYGSSSANITNN